MNEYLQATLGQKLVVKRGAVKTTERTASTDPGSYNESIYHVVQPGDTLWSIAQRYPGVSVEDLRRLNSDLNGLKPGTKIKVRAPQG
jgi:membrane-bound lytic murein transglycosylase D